MLADLQRSMLEASERRDFEAAAAYRDRVEALRHVLERQQIESSSLGSSDIVGLAADEWGANVQVFINRDGKLADRRSFTMENVEGADEEQIFVRFVGEYYAATPTVPAELIVPRRVANTGALAEFLQRLRGTRVDVRVAERGDKRRLQELADRNAQLALAHERARQERSRERRLGALSSLQECLRLSGPPVRIEGFDVSNLGDENIVASMVVFEGGAAKKEHYRKFTIRSTAGQDDVGSMREALARRFIRLPESDETRYDPSFESVPDLVLIDGGKGQLGAAISALREAGLGDVVPVVSLAKREEEVYTTWSGEPLRFPTRRPRSSAVASGPRRGPSLRNRFPAGETSGSDHRVALGSTAGDRREEEESHRAAFRLTGEIPAGIEGRTGSGPGASGQSRKGDSRVCAQDRLITRDGMNAVGRATL